MSLLIDYVPRCILVGDQADWGPVDAIAGPLWRESENVQ